MRCGEVRWSARRRPGLQYSKCGDPDHRDDVGYTLGSYDRQEFKVEVGVRPAQRRDLHPDLRSQQAETHRVQALNRSLPRTGLVALLSLLPLTHAQADSLHVAAAAGQHRRQRRRRPFALR